MNLGMKTGPQKQSVPDLIAAKPFFTEIWYNINRTDDYDELFACIKSNKIKSGLHFWGALDDQTWANIAYPDTDLINKSLDLMRRTIDIAAANNSSYVNIHPGSYAKLKIDFQNKIISVISKPVSLDKSTDIFLENIGILNNYAQNKNIILTVETVPPKVFNHWNSNVERQNSFDCYELPVSAIEKAADQGIYIANDFGHTACNLITDDANSIFNYLYQKTQILSRQTKLIHLGFINRPFNGADNHLSLDRPEFLNLETVPHQDSIIELLRIFQNRPDIFILVEPDNDHVKNYFLAKKLLLKVGVFDN